MKFLICFLSLSALVFCAPDVYWRPYNGIVPEDAVVGDSEGLYRSYIGRVSIKDKGLFIGQLYGGSASIEVCEWTQQSNKSYTRTEFIEILCSSHLENLQWADVDKNNLYNISADLVGGGHQFSVSNKTEVPKEYELYVGRYNYFGYKIGQIDPYFNSYAPSIIFVTNGTMAASSGFEVLTYQGVN